MSAGQLAMHIASIPANLTRMAKLDGFDVAGANFNPPAPNSVEEVLATLETGLADVQNYLSGMTEEAAMTTWRLSSGEREVFSMPRVGLLRTIMLNHWYHHRGQMSVYLRLLDVPVPVIYGRSADENPFG